MRLQPHEIEIIGAWISSDGKVWGDAKAERIDWLVDNVLHERAVSPEHGRWAVLYVDPADGRLWELTHPESHLHGGGPHSLRVISQEEARRKYRT